MKNLKSRKDLANAIDEQMIDINKAMLATLETLRDKAIDDHDDMTAEHLNKHILDLTRQIRSREVILEINNFKGFDTTN